ncbi:MAG: hypothetical protein K2J20_04605 [Bacilli bacterium]|nr:hypothetical protein [Bacilli bacterium]
MKTRKIVGLIIGSILLLIIVNVGIIKCYQNYVYRTINNVVNNLSDKYPELENDIMDGILNENATDKVLIKYGITKDSLKEIVFYKEAQKNIIVITTSMYMAIILIMGIIYGSYKWKVKREIQIINNYLKEILRGSYELNIADYNEDEISILNIFAQT